jgi:hypothetical protein
MDFTLSREKVEVIEVKYNFWDMLSDLGGVLELLTVVFYPLLFPFVKLSFELKMMKQLFKARCSDSTVLKRD